MTTKNLLLQLLVGLVVGVVLAAVFIKAEKEKPRDTLAPLLLMAS